MARSIRSSNLETRSTRLKMKVSKKPKFQKIGPGIGLGYRRNETAGTWVVRLADGKGGNWTKGIGAADDFQDADGATIFDFWQAQDRARAIARSNRTADESSRPLSVSDALAQYETDLKSRNGDPGNAARVISHVTKALGDKSILLLTSRDLKGWRDRLAKTLAPATVNRIATCLKAALNAAADHDDGILTRRAWEVGLAAIPDAQEPRNVVLEEGQIRPLIEKAYAISSGFGLFVETAAVTGARPSQLARLQVRDIQGNRSDPRLMMPSSRKGRGKKISHFPVPITSSLLEKLSKSANGRGANEQLLLKQTADHSESSGNTSKNVFCLPWNKSDHSRPMKKAVKAAGLDPAEVTIYALRHSNIVRQLLANVPIRVVATNHDTSTVMIERNYSRHIGDYSDQLARRALLDLAVPTPSNNI
jgi:integrase